MEQKKETYVTPADAWKAFCGDPSAADAARCRMMERMAAEGMMRVVEKEGGKNVK